MLTPTNESELSDTIVATTGTLWVRGGGTRLSPPVEAQVLSTAGLRGITLYEPGALTLVAQAGTPVAEIEATLAAENQRLAFEPMDHRALLGTNGDPTIGGVVAANVSGPRRVQTGACRDFLIGVRFVDGRGDIIKNGGRVMKNVTGYDLVKLMAGSWGTLGVLTEVAFKVLPDTATQACVLIDNLTDAQAVQAMAAALAAPYEVTGAAHLPKGVDGHPVTMLRLEGFADSVAYRTAKLRDILAPYGETRVETDPAQVRAGWAYIRDVGPFHGQSGDVWRISVRPGDGPDIAARTGGQAFYDWGGGLIWVLVAEGTYVRTRLGVFNGHATRVRGGGTDAASPRFQPEAPPVAAISAGLRHQFDPRGVLNPGLMG